MSDSDVISQAPRFTVDCDFWAPAPGILNAIMRATLPKVVRNGRMPGYDMAFQRQMKNVVCVPGKNDLLDKYFAGSAYTAVWYGGLISLTSYTAIANTDTLASHAGWLEAGGANAPAYSAANRSTITFGAAATGVKASTAITAFTFSSAGTVKGLFITTAQVKDATAGILYSAGLFTAGDAPVGSGYVLTCTCSVTQT